MSDNKTIAAAARRIAADAPAGSLTRRAGGVVSIATGTTNTLKAARLVLGSVDLDDVRTEALELLDRLAASAETAPTSIDRTPKYARKPQKRARR